MKKVIFNCETKESVEIDLTEEEITQYEKDVAQIAIFEQNERLAQVELAKKKATAEAKLAALGLDASDLKALGL